MIVAVTLFDLFEKLAEITETYPAQLLEDRRKEFEERAELQARHNDWLDEQRTQEEARY